MRNAKRLGLRVCVLVCASAAIALTANAISPIGLDLWTNTSASSATPAAEADGMHANTGAAAQADLPGNAIDVATAKSIVEVGEHLVLDARLRESFVRGHLPGAISVPYENGQADLAAVQIFLAPDQPMLIYCSGAACHDSAGLAELIRKHPQAGDIKVLTAGFNGWKQAGYPIEQGE